MFETHEDTEHPGTGRKAVSTIVVRYFDKYINQRVTTLG